MKITIIGGSKGTGARLAEVARDAGHDVTVLSRSGDAPDGVRGVTGNARDSASAREAVRGADAVVVTVGGAKGVARQRTEVTRSVIDAMHAEGVRRLVVQSSLGAGDSSSQLPGILGLVTKVMLAKPLADHDAQEAATKASGLDWTIVRPTGLKNQPGTGRWQALEVTNAGKLNSSIPRDDLARYMLSVLENPDTLCKAFGVSG